MKPIFKFVRKIYKLIKRGFKLVKKSFNLTKHRIAREFLFLILGNDVKVESIVKVLRKRNLISPKLLHQILQQLHNSKKYNKIISILNDSRELGYVEALHHLRLYKISQTTHLDPLWTERARETPSDHFLRRPMIAAAIDCLVRSERIVDLELQLQQISDEEWRALNFTVIRGIINLFLKLHMPERIGNVVDRVANSSPDRIFNLLEIEVLISRKPNSEVINWRDLLLRLEEEYNWKTVEDRKCFTELVVDPMRMLLDGQERKLMSIRYDTNEKLTLLNAISLALVSRQSLSLVRLGDGESYVFPSPHTDKFDDNIHLEDRRKREKIWWGINLDEKSSNDLSNSVLQAIDNADILGIPSVFRVIRDLGASKSNIFNKNASLRGVAVVLYGLNKMISRRAQRTFTEERCHQILFDENTIKQLSVNASNTVVISCWTEEELSLSLSGKVEYITIPAHGKVLHLTGQSPKQDSFYSRLSAICDQIDATCGPGTLLLVGAGILGKICIERARKKGAVALDVGAMMDYYAGVKTRSIADLV